MIFRIFITFPSDYFGRHSLYSGNNFIWSRFSHFHYSGNNDHFQFPTRFSHNPRRGKILRWSPSKGEWFYISHKLLWFTQQMDLHRLIWLRFATNWATFQEHHRQVTQYLWCSTVTTTVYSLWVALRRRCGAKGDTKMMTQEEVSQFSSFYSNSF